MAFLIGAAVLIPIILVVAAVAFDKTMPLLFAHQRMLWVAIAVLQLPVVAIQLGQKQFGPSAWLAILNCVLAAWTVARLSARRAA